VSVIELPPKKRTLSDQIDLDSLDFSGAWDPEKYLSKTFLERQVEGIVGKFLAVNRVFHGFFQKSQRNNDIQTLLDADAILRKLEPMLAQDSRVPPVRVEQGENRFYGPATSYLARGQISWVAEWLKAHLRDGRPPETATAQCAEELARLFRRETGRPNWRLVGDILNLALGGFDRSDRARWAHNLVKRHKSKAKKR